MTEATRPVIQASSSAAIDESIDFQLLSVLDSFGLGVIWLDDQHRVRHGNDLAEAMLGTSLSELHGEVFMAGNWDLRQIDGTAVTEAAYSKSVETHKTWDRPVDLQIRNRSGRTVRLRVTMGACERCRRANGDRRAVILQELTDADEPARPAEVADPQAEFVGLLASLRTTLDELEKLSGTHPRKHGLPAEFAALTARETDILNYLLEGMRVSTIAQHRYLSQHTVRNHLRSIFKKLGVTSQAELIRLARGLD